jgi:tetratricopeptide (TPR) repeat protein
MDNGFCINIKTIKSILLAIYENKPDFPIDSKEILSEVLGGNDQVYYLNPTEGDQSALELAERSFQNFTEISEPNQIIDAIIGESYVNIITKAKLLETIQSLKYPIESKSDLLTNLADLVIYGVPINDIAEKLDYPVDKPDQIINRLKLHDQKLIEANMDLIDELMKSETESTDKDISSITSELESEEISLKEKLKKIIAMGKDAYRDKKYELAIRIYDEGLDLDPDNTEIRFLQKTVKAKIEDITKAEKEDTEEAKPEEEQPSKPEEIEPKAEVEPESKVEPESESKEQPPDAVESLETSKPSEPKGSAEPPGKPKEFSPADIEGEELHFNDSKIEMLEKKLQEKVQVLRDLAKPDRALPEDACKSCEGSGKCYWCGGSTKCKICSGSGKTEAGEECNECKGSGECHSCQGNGQCHWCKGTGKKSE